MQFLWEAKCTAFPQPEQQRAFCFASMYRNLSVVQWCYMSRMLTYAHALRLDQGNSEELPRALRVKRLALFASVAVLDLVVSCWLLKILLG
jgi:hypothetical protein